MEKIKLYLLKCTYYNSILQLLILQELWEDFWILDASKDLVNAGEEGMGKITVWEIEQDCQEKDITFYREKQALKTYTSKVEVICIKYT